MKPSQKRYKKSYSVRFDTTEIEKEAIQPYKEKIKILKDKLRQREDYIYKLHWRLRRPRPLFYAMASFHMVNVSLPAFLTPRRMLILYLMNNKTLVLLSSIEDRVNKIMTHKGTVARDVGILKKHDLLFSDDNKYYTITDKGKQFVSYYEHNARVFFSNSMKHDKEIVNISLHKNKKFSVEEIEKRREFYKYMMAPFWDAGITKIPKDIVKRIEIVSAYMTKYNIKGDETYRRLIFKWSSKK